MEVLHPGRAAPRGAAPERTAPAAARGRTAGADLQLRELVEDGLVAKTIYAELPPRSEYALTELGASLLPIIDAMIAWGTRNAALFERKYRKRG